MPKDLAQKIARHETDAYQAGIFRTPAVCLGGGPLLGRSRFRSR